MNTLLLSLAIFVVVLALLVSLRVRTGAKFDVKNTDIALALVPIALWLFLTGKVQEFTFGDFKIVSAIREASKSDVAPQVTKMPVENIQVASKGGVGMIPRLLEQKSQALGFRLGQGSYYYGPAISEYFRVLSQSPYLKYVVINEADDTFFGMMDARQLGALLSSPAGGSYSASLADWLNNSSKDQLQSLPGFISWQRALREGTDKQRALQTMDSLDVQVLPVVSPDRKFVGVADRSKLTASILIDVAERIDSQR